MTCNLRRASLFVVPNPVAGLTVAAMMCKSSAMRTGTSTPLAATLAGNIRAARDDAELTQRQLAQRIDVAQMLVSNWERGVNRPSDPNLFALAEALGVSVAWFYTEHPVKQEAA